MSKKSILTDSVYKENIPFTVSNCNKQKAKEKLEKYKKEELKNVKGIFQFHECPGGSTTITLKKYAGHFFKKVMQDGETYEVPLYVARFLNGIDVTAEYLNGNIGSGAYELHNYIMSPEGVPLLNTQKRKRRFSFQSLEFLGDATEGVA